ncbi:uncharacterized protein K441DRAFT_88398 [Cenococcum geophilum 1.58]|uniref:Uncharacterized protein n=1 Tax=Cenococcum geophilum 1.58 TaxID=794803 RepID=A0ACC8EJV9_9PEZI|nr:hypothetical protein K441DRAFT_88398 [Cenococcum geophilum 1.58]
MQRCPISESSLSSTARVKRRKLGNIWALKDYLDGDVSFEQRDHFPLPKYHPRNYLPLHGKIKMSILKIVFMASPAHLEYLKDTYNIHEVSDYNSYLETSDKEYLKDEAPDYKNCLETRYNWLQESVTKNTAGSSKLRSCNMCLGLPNLKRWLPREFYEFNSSSLDSFAKRLRETGKGRKLFATGVSLGFGPSLMRTGDSVWLLESQRVPFLLRELASKTCTLVSCELAFDARTSILCEHASDTRAFEFMGACYLHEAARDHDICAKCGAEVPRLLDEWQTINIR